MFSPLLTPDCWLLRAGGRGDLLRVSGAHRACHHRLVAARAQRCSSTHPMLNHRATGTVIRVQQVTEHPVIECSLPLAGAQIASTSGASSRAAVSMRQQASRRPSRCAFCDGTAARSDRCASAFRRTRTHTYL